VQQQACGANGCSIGQCADGYKDCNSDPTDGCEVNVKTDVNHCGSCGHACSLANATSDCSSGSCTVSSCMGTYANCNNDPIDGCESNLQTDKANCGSCKHACANADDSCDAGQCVSPCGLIPPAGLAVCVLYAKAIMGNDTANVPFTDYHVGLTGGVNAFMSPWSGCVNPATAGSEPYVLCLIGNPAPPMNADIEFRPGLHATTQSGAYPGTFDCDTAACASTVFVYNDGVEIATYKNGVPSSGTISVVSSTVPPYFKNFKVVSP
jgi:hypothetical protein